MNNKPRLPLVIAMLAGAIVSASGFAGGPKEDYSTGRLIVLYKDGAVASHRQSQTVVSSAGAYKVRTSAIGAHVFALPPGMNAEQAKRVADQLRALPEVASVEPDVIVRPQFLADSASAFAGPSYAQFPDFPYAIDISSAREMLAGKMPTPVAVVDTGITVHTALPPGNILPGYDFYTFGGSARSSSDSDPGDWVTQAEHDNDPAYASCTVTDSTWHGTAMAGVIAAAHNDGYHLEGVATGAALLPARAIGKCGGYLSDVMDAALWSAGISVPGVPDNQNPVRIVNLSLGAPAGCGTYYQNAVNQLLAKGVVVVAAGGNNNENTMQVIPAACAGVLAVVASDRDGDLASYSASGTNVTVAAPGGERTLGIMTTSNTGLTTPVSETNKAYYGTSNSAAIVSGVVSLMLTANPALQPAGVAGLLKATATPMPACNGSCGGGQVDANAAVKAAFEGVIYADPAWSSVTVGSSATSTLNVNNVSGLAVTFGQASFVGPNAGDFAKTKDTCSGTTLNDGDACAIVIGFTPAYAGTRQATIQVSSNMPSGGIRANLVAVGDGAASTTPAQPPGTEPSATVSTGGGGSGGGGCAVAANVGQADPSLLALAVMAAIAIFRRRQHAH